MNWNDVYETAKEIAIDAGELIKVRMSETVSVDSKKDANDLVTNVDREVESFIIERVLTKYPEHQILGEEGMSKSALESGKITWIIDPIDGTVNFVHSRRNFAILMSVYHEEVGMVAITYDVMNGEMFHALKGNGAYLDNNLLPKLNEVPICESVIGINPTPKFKIDFASNEAYDEFIGAVRATRSFGSAGLQMAYVAAGILDAYVKRKLCPWDFAAGKILINEVGGQVVDLAGNEVSISGDSSIVAAKPGFYDEFSEKYL